jgi:hypothetical protein
MFASWLVGSWPPALMEEDGVSDFVEGSVGSDRGLSTTERAGTSMERSRHGRSLGWLAAVVGIVLLAALAVSAVAIAGPAHSRLAVRLASRDPGARVNGDTIVVTGGGAGVHGARGRPNLIAALGSRETIVGGNRGDNLAALGDRVTIIGGGGNDLLYGGREATLVGGGGRDLLVDRGANAIIRAGSGDVVIGSGRHDRVMCSRGSRNVTVYAGRSDPVSSRCRAGHGRVLPLRRLRRVRQSARAAAAGVVTGNGSNDHPFSAPCDNPGNVDCTISAFPERTLSGAWANEYVPAYVCPSDHPYRLNKNYAPSFNTWGPGVEIVRDDVSGLGFPVNVLITGNSYFNERTPPNLFSGTLTGFPNSSATNWLWGGTHHYRIVLHCTSDRCHGTDLVGRPPGCARGAIADRPRQAGSAKRLDWSGSSPGQP